MAALTVVLHHGVSEAQVLYAGVSFSVLVCAAGVDNKSWTALDFHLDTPDNYTNVFNMNGTYSAVSMENVHV